MFGNFFKKQEAPSLQKNETPSARPESIPVPNSLDMAKEHFAKIIGNYPETSDEASYLLLKEFGTINRTRINEMLNDPENKDKIRMYGTLNDAAIAEITSREAA